MSELSRRLLEPIPHPVFADVIDEVARAVEKHGPMQNGHEAYGVIMEEVAEFFDEIRKQQLDKAATRKELIQIAAMACRAIIDLRL